MSAAAKPESEHTAVATRPKRELAPESQARIDDIRARNQMVAAIRQTQWGTALAVETQRAVAEYCRQNNLDPVRHVEILGGRIYLTADFFDERGADLIRDGVVMPEEPDYVHADKRLDELAAKGDAWAIEESTRRIRARIEYAIPENATAAVVQLFKLASGATIVGVNWCGSGSKKDPVGDAEPAKTAQTRARRRAWKQIANVIPGYAERVRPIEASAKLVSDELPVSVVDAPRETRPMLSQGDDPYSNLPAPPAQHSADPPGCRAEDHEQDGIGELAPGAERKAPTPRKNALREP